MAERKEHLLGDPCPSCGSYQMKVKMLYNRISLYCGECGKFIQFLNDAELRKVYRIIENRYGKVKQVLRKFQKQRDGTYIIRCSRCQCQLCNTRLPEPMGQFNLKDAEYCPKCGGKLI